MFSPKKIKYNYKILTNLPVVTISLHIYLSNCRVVQLEFMECYIPIIFVKLEKQSFGVPVQVNQLKKSIYGLFTNSKNTRKLDPGYL